MKFWIKYCFRYLLFLTILFIIPIIIVVGLNFYKRAFDLKEILTISFYLYWGLLLLISTVLGTYTYLGEKYFHEKNKTFNKSLILVLFLGLLILLAYPTVYFFNFGSIGLLKGQLISLVFSIVGSFIIASFISRLNERQHYFLIGIYFFFAFQLVSMILNLINGLSYGITKLHNGYLLHLLGASILFILVSIIAKFSIEKKNNRQ